MELIFYKEVDTDILKVIPVTINSAYVFIDPRLKRQIVGSYIKKIIIEYRRFLWGRGAILAFINYLI
jgi:hypothetical protein